MAINEWGIWRKMGMVKDEVEEVKIEEDIGAALDFLKEIEVGELIRRLEKMKEMVKEGKVIDEGLKADNLEKQIKAFDEVLRDYGFLENDTDINGLRLRRVGGDLLRKAKEVGLNDLVKEKKKDMKWRV